MSIRIPPCPKDHRSSVNPRKKNTILASPHTKSGLGIKDKGLFGRTLCNIVLLAAHNKGPNCWSEYRYREGGVMDKIAGVMHSDV